MATTAPGTLLETSGNELLTNIHHGGSRAFTDASVTGTSRDVSAEDDVTGSDDSDDDVYWSTSSFIYVTIGLIGVIGNAMVVVVIMKTKSLKSKQINKLILNQSAIDLVTSLLLMVHSLFNMEAKGLSGTSGDWYCKLLGTKIFMWSGMFSSTYSLLVITLERYLEVVHPIWHRNALTPQRVRTVMVSCWFYGLLYLVPYGIPTSEVLGGACIVFAFFPNPATQKFVGILTLTLQYFLPVSVMIFCYTRIASVVRSRIAPTDKNRTEAQTRRDAKARKANSNVIKTLGFCVACYCLCWGFNQFLFLAYNLGYPASYSSLGYHTSVYLVYTNLCVNPVVYSFKYQQFQAAARRIFCMSKSSATSEMSQSMGDTVTENVKTDP